MMRSSRSTLRALALAPLVALGGAALAAAQAGDASPPAASIRAVRYHVEPGRTRLWFETGGPVLYTHYSPDPLTLVIDLPGVELWKVAERTVVGSREVESVVATRLTSTNGKTLSRIEIRLGSLVPYQISATEYALTVLFEGTRAEEPSPVAVPDEPRPAASTPPVPAKPSSSGPDSPERGKSFPAASQPASAIHSLSHVFSDELLTVTLRSDGRLNYTSFRLQGPERLVFDFNGVTNLVSQATVPIGAAGVARARIAQFRPAQPRITRVVFDIAGPTAHRAVEEGVALKIYFADSQEKLARVIPLASMEERASAAELPPSPSPVLNPNPPPAAPARVETPPASESSGEASAALAGRYDAETKEAEQPQVSENGEATAIRPVAIVAQTPLGAVPSTGAEAPSAGVPAPALPAPGLLPEPPVEQPSPQQPPGGQVPPSFEARTIGAEEKLYTGELITLDFKDGDINDIFRLFADISGLNIVVQPGVAGKVTLKLTEVPWDQALELILKTHKLGYIQEGNVIRIAPLADLAVEEAEKRKLAEEKALAGELTTMTKVLSYAKAKEVEPLIKRNLSQRGDIVIDERTNTVIVTDLPDRIDNINTLIQSLDTPIPGVEIEARIIVTTRDFSRQLGIQWGFTGEMSQLFGNTTELVFPNSVLVSGQPIGSDVVEEFKGPETGGGLLPPQIGADDAQRGYAVNLPFAGTPTGAIGVSLGSITGAFSIDAALTAAERRGQVRILSAPKIITQNNKAATIKQGVTFPVQVVANNTVTVQFKDAVLQLTVTPQITSAETIILDILVNNDELDFARSVQGIPSIVTQSATTQVLVPDGSTTVVGGVFRNIDNRQERYVPLLHRVPLLGHLFKSSDRTTRNEELLIFLTPRIRKGQV